MSKSEDSLFNWRMSGRMRFVLNVYSTAVVLISAIGLILQVRLVTLQQRIILDDNPDLQLKLRETLDLMLITGQLFRDCGAMGIGYYSLVVAAVLVYFIPSINPELKLFDYFRENRPLAYLMDPEGESKRARLIIDKYLQKIIRSNASAAAIAVGELNEGDLYEYFKKACVLGREFDELDKEIDDNYFQLIEGEYTETHECRKRKLRSIEQCISRHMKVDTTLSKSTLSSRVHSSNDNHSIAKIKFLTAIRDQLQYLVRLKSNKRKIWMPYRNLTWATWVRKKYRIVGPVSYIALWTFAMHVAYSSVTSSYIEIKSSHFDMEYREITLPDQLTGLNYLYLGYFVSTASIDSLLLLMLTFLNIHEQFNVVDFKVSQFSRKLSQLTCLRQKTRLKYPVSGIELYRTKRDLYYECDTSALELYINYMIFEAEMKASIKKSQYVTDQFVSFLAISAGPILLYLRFVLLEKARDLTMVFILLFIWADLLLLISGYINSHCLKYTRRIWSLIAYAERYNLDAFNSRCLLRPEIYNGFPEIEDGINLDHEYHLNSFLTYHTMRLWRQLATHQDLAADYFSFKLFGILEITYSSILRYNFWTISVALIILNASSC